MRYGSHSKSIPGNLREPPRYNAEERWGSGESLGRVTLDPKTEGAALNSVSSDSLERSFYLGGRGVGEARGERTLVSPRILIQVFS